MIDTPNDHARVTPEGRELGAHLARLTEPWIGVLAAAGVPDTRCKSCAFRLGTVPNGCAETQLDAMKAVLERKSFTCHSHPDPEGPAATLCHGWTALQFASAGKPAMKVPWSFSPPDSLIEALQVDGYTDLVQLMDGVLCGIFRFNFTYGLVVGLDANGYSRRYCFEREAHARAALQAWDGIGHAPGPWIKCKGRYLGAPIDLLNPDLRA